MFSYYLQHRSYYYASEADVKSHIHELSSIITRADQYDHFFMSKVFEEGIFDRWSSIGDYFNSGRVSNSISLRVWPSIKKRCKLLETGYMSLEEMNKHHFKTSNAFLGPLFIFKTSNLITTFRDYSLFRDTNAHKMVNSSNFGACCRICFKYVTLTQDASNMVKSLGSIAVPVFHHLFILDQYIKSDWSSGSFSLADAVSKTSLSISDESETVKQTPHLKRHRYFCIPGFGKQYCFLHLKLGDLRIHFFVDNVSRRVFIPYIGSHLPL